MEKKRKQSAKQGGAVAKQGAVKIVFDPRDKPFRAGRRLSSAGVTFDEIAEEEWFQKLFRSQPDGIGLLLLGMGVGYFGV